MNQTNSRALPRAVPRAFRPLLEMVVGLGFLVPEASFADQSGTQSSAKARGAAPMSSSIYTDRPTKSNYACTVDAGHFQYEADILSESFLRLDGVTTDTWLTLSPTLKYGLSPNVDIEASFSPLATVRTHDTSGNGRTLTGVSDLYARMKYKFLDTEDGGLQAAILPYVKAPTARIGIGNGAVEGGVLLPVNYKLTDLITLTTVPEIDFFKDAVGNGRHVNTAQLINLGVSLPHGFTLYGELWGDWNFDPAGTTRQFSADAAVAYGVTPHLQLDAGLNFGLNKYTPGVQAYIGVSQKF